MPGFGSILEIGDRPHDFALDYSNEKMIRPRFSPLQESSQPLRFGLS